MIYFLVLPFLFFAIASLGVVYLLADAYLASSEAQMEIAKQGDLSTTVDTLEGER